MKGPRSGSRTTRTRNKIFFIPNNFGAEYTYSSHYSKTKYNEPKQYKHLPTVTIRKNVAKVIANGTNQRGLEVFESVHGQQIDAITREIDFVSGSIFSAGNVTFTSSSNNSSDVKFIITKARHTLSLTNMSNSSVRLRIHHISCKRDVPRGSQLASVCDPLSAIRWGLYYKAQIGNRSNWTDVSLNPDVPFYKSHYFQRYFGISKTYKMDLSPGQSHKHQWTRSINYNMSFQDQYLPLDSATLPANSPAPNVTSFTLTPTYDVISGLTQYILLEWTPSIALQDSTQNIGIPPVNIASHYTAEISAKIDSYNKSNYVVETSALNATGSFVGTNPETGAININKDNTK